MAGFVYPHPGRPYDNDWAVLGDFTTGQSGLQQVHERWLDRRAMPALERRDWVFVRGMASRQGTDRGYDNLLLSKNRARAVEHYLRSHAAGDAIRITRVDAIGDRRSSGDANDNNGYWRSVEVVITRHRITDLPPIDITVPIPNPRPRRPRPPRFGIRMKFSMSVGPLAAASFVIRDSWNRTEALFDYRAVGLGVAPGNIGGSGRFSQIPDDGRLRSLADFNLAFLSLDSVDGRSRDGATVVSWSRLRMTPLRATRSIVIRDFDTGRSLLPDAGGVVGELRQVSPAEPAGTFD